MSGVDQALKRPEAVKGPKEVKRPKKAKKPTVEEQAVMRMIKSFSEFHEILLNKGASICQQMTGLPGEAGRPSRHFALWMEGKPIKRDYRNWDDINKKEVINAIRRNGLGRAGKVQSRSKKRLRDVLVMAEEVPKTMPVGEVRPESISLLRV
ncbi:hypothetical protein BDZ45DRAFT_689848 [Acephala macrosclerotiorum]|nr:hypothetical protein BDZ45DRAFT_689848 [Acephala macrosclerotiorum]